MQSIAVSLNGLRIIAFFCVFVGLLLLGCSPSSKTLSGQVFVVTQGRENVKLALVEVIAISESEMAEHLKKQRVKAVEQRKLLAPQLVAGEKAARASAQHFFGSESSIDRIKQLGYEGPDWLSRSEHAPVNTILDFHILTRKFESLDTPAYYLSGLPPPAGVGKTDADGKFTLKVPSGRHVIVAMSSRKVLAKTENYVWAVRVDTASAVQPLILSNDNQFETTCKDCLLLPKD